MFRRAWIAFLRFAFHQFYNPFAFTYDFVSAVVSRGRWRAWTRAAIPRLVGTRVLELACGTGNLLLDLGDAGYAPVGVDPSPSMLRIARGKLKRAAAEHPERQSKQAPSQGAPRLIRARAQALPFANCSFDSIVMTFPPGFIYDPRAPAEIRRLLADAGRLIWVDAGRLSLLGWGNRLINHAFELTGGSGDLRDSITDLLAKAGFQTITETVPAGASSVMVVVATKC